MTEHRNNFLQAKMNNIDGVSLEKQNALLLKQIDLMKANIDLQAEALQDARDANGELARQRDALREEIEALKQKQDVDEEDLGMARVCKHCDAKKIETLTACLAEMHQREAQRVQKVDTLTKCLKDGRIENQAMQSILRELLPLLQVLDHVHMYDRVNVDALKGCVSKVRLADLLIVIQDICNYSI